MKVVHLSCVAPPYHGGIGRVALEEVKHLQARGVDTFVMAPYGGGDPNLIKRLPARVVFGNAAIGERTTLQTALADADVVHLHYPFYGTAGSVARLRRQGKIEKLVMTLHMDARATGLKGKVFDAHRALFQKKVLDSADALLMSSRDYAKHSSFEPWASKVVELPFGVNEDFFSPGSDERSVFDIPKGVRCITFVGGMDKPHAFKGVDMLLYAMKELPTDVWCVLVGGGSLQSKYKKLAEGLGIASRVKFLGPVADGNLVRVYRLGTVHAFPSVSGAEAFGLVAVEAQACGTPVVASDLPGVRTVVENGVTGFLSAPGDPKELAKHLRRLLDDAELRHRFSSAARSRVLEKFTWTKHTDGLMKVYEDVCASRS